MANFYPNMYGGGASPAGKPTTPAPVKIPPAHQRLSGLKLTNSHMHEVVLGDQAVTIPSAAYIKLLEDQIKEFRKLLREQQNQIRRISNNSNRLIQEIDRIKIDLAKKVDRRNP